MGVKNNFVSAKQLGCTVIAVFCCLNCLSGFVRFGEFSAKLVLIAEFPKNDDRDTFCRRLPPRVALDVLDVASRIV